MKRLFYLIIPFFLVMLFLVACDKNNNSKTNDNGNDSGSRTLLDTARSIKIVQIDGSATVTDSEETLNCYTGMNLYDGDTVDVNSESVIVLRFDEDKYVYLGEDTTVSIKSEGKDKFKTNIYVEKGLVLAELQNKLGEDEEFFLSSNNSVMAVRGTVFGVSVKEVDDEIIETYSVYQGVTELFVFDIDGTEIIKGKLSDISNAKIEIKIPKSHALPKDQFDNILSYWLKDITSEFDDAVDANSKLNGVNITVGKPSREDYQVVIDILYGPNGLPDSGGNDPISYSDIQYTSTGYFGSYDGNPHGVTVNAATPGSIIYYKAEGETDYKTTNDYEFVSPGSYRVYYKIVCDGYDDKEDFEVVYITYPNVRIETECITFDNTSGSSKLSLDRISDASFNVYNGVLASEILENAKYYIGDEEIVANNVDISYDSIVENYIELKDGKNTLHATFEFDNYSFDVDIDFLFVDSREDLGYSVAASDDTIIELGGNIYYYSSLSMADSGYAEINGSDLLTAFGLDFDPSDLNKVFINLPYEVYTNPTNMEPYDGNNKVYLNFEEFTKVNFIIFPSSENKGYNETIYVYTGNGDPNDSPIYDVKNLNYAYDPEKTPEGVLMDFIDSKTAVVTYSLDGNTFTDSLYVTAEGMNKVYFRVTTPSNATIEGYEFINVVVGQGKIAFDNVKFITKPIYILSDDNYELTYSRIVEGMSNTETVLSTNGKTITSLDDCFTVYSNLVKNSTFYDSISKEEIEATVTITRTSGANFNYVVTADGYDSISGIVKFVNVGFGDIEILSGSGLEQISVEMPEDLNIDLNDVSSVVPSRPALSCENNLVAYQAYYSIDEGKTWTTDVLRITEAGTYQAYVLYCFVDPNNDATDLVDSDNLESDLETTLSATGNFIVSVQNIIVE